MTTPYAGSPVFPTSVTLISDGDPDTAALNNSPIEANRDAVVYLKTITDSANGGAIRNLRGPVVVDSVGSPLSFVHVRPDGTSTGFYSTTYSLWIKCGVNTAGDIALGDRATWGVYNTAAAAPPKVSFGCDSAIGFNPGRVVVFNADLKTSGGGVDPKYILGPAVGDFTGTWTTKSLDAIGNFTTYVRAWDCIVTPTQRVIVAGGGDNGGGTGNFLVWKSDDFGNTFSRVTVGTVSASQDGLTRVIVGKNGRLVAWIKTSTANQGNKLFYSDDNGDTWSSRSAIGFDQITEGVYLADLDLWAFASTSGLAIYTTPDPVLGAFTANAIGIAATSMGGFGHYLVYAQEISAIRDSIFLSIDGMNNVGIIGRDPTLSGSSIVNVAASPLGQLLISTDNSLTLTDRV